MNRLPTNIDITSILRFCLILTGLGLMVVYGSEAMAQANSWQAVAGTGL